MQYHNYRLCFFDKAKHSSAKEAIEASQLFETEYCVDDLCMGNEEFNFGNFLCIVEQTQLQRQAGNTDVVAGMFNEKGVFVSLEYAAKKYNKDKTFTIERVEEDKYFQGLILDEM
ncbi:hypothetical protein [Vibrio barjaei]|uniref:hypothetical protein n=1 Tax=Vibrio barjaei TaxID=1676683 RepID=UPI0022849AC9|nr:hypothetical protein [Vibrio barjaei]MCY9870466.1 hypothetical protein [Vibrio barjaei]